MESQAKKVSQMIVILDRVLRSRRTYQSDNPICVRLMDEVWGYFSELLSNGEELRLTLFLFEFRWENEVVYQNTSRSESLAFKISSEGIKSLTFLPGLTREELSQFVDCLSGLYKSALLEDVLGKFWEADLPNITYTIEESLAEGSEEQNKDTLATEENVRQILDPQRSHYEGDAKEPDDIFEDINVTVTVPSMGNLFKDNASLTAQEYEYIQKDLEECEKYERLLLDFVDMLLAVLQEEKKAEDFQKFFDPLKEVIRSCLMEQNLELALKIMEQLHQFPERSPHVKTLYPDFIEHSMGQIWNADTLELVLVAIKKNNKPLEVLETLLAKAPTTFLPTLLQKALSVPEMPIKLCLLRSVASLHKGDFGVLHSLLYSNEVDQIRLGLYILVHTKNPRAIEPLERLLKHKNPIVRKDVITSLRTFPGPKTNRLLLDLLEDPNEDLRIVALRQLASVGDKDIARKLGETLGSPLFKEKSIQERKAYFFAVAGIMKDDFVPHLKNILSTTSWFQNEHLKELYQCATLALSLIGTPLARQTLENSINSSDKTVRRLSELALRQIGKEVIHEAK